jgi:hypothetical protein
MMTPWLEKLKPAVQKNILLLLSGVLWIVIGFMLSRYAFLWLTAYTGKGTIVFAGIGFFASLIIHHFGFLRVVDKNLDRISHMHGARCVFSFMSWKSYGMVAIMMTGGILLRFSLIPKQYLSILYIAIGAALFLSSIRYLRVFVHQL